MSSEYPEGTVSVHEILQHIDRDRYMDLAQAIDYLCISERNLRDRLREIPHYRVGKKILFKKSHLDEYMERHRVRTSDSTGPDLQRLAQEAVSAVLGRAK